MLLSMTPTRNAPYGLAQAKGSNGNVAALSTALGSPDFHLPFFHYLTIPKSTTQVSYLSYNLDLPIGRINRVWVESPRGCSGLAGLQVFHGVQQIFPLPAGVWFRSDNSVLSFALTHDMTYEPFQLQLRGYNDDDTYSHTLWISFEMSGQQKDLPPQLQGLINYLKGS